MHQPYDDIKSLIPQEPLWFDENGVPRYQEYAPELAANIYAEEQVLLLIACQSCKQPFKVCMTTWAFDRLSIMRELTKWKAEPTGRDWPPVHYGDPPFHTNEGQQCTGTTMNCDELNILQVWRRGDRFEWERMVEFENLPLTIEKAEEQNGAGETRRAGGSVN